MAKKTKRLSKASPQAAPEQSPHSPAVLGVRQRQMAGMNMEGKKKAALIAARGVKPAKHGEHSGMAALSAHAGVPHNQMMQMALHSKNAAHFQQRLTAAHPDTAKKFTASQVQMAYHEHFAHSLKEQDMRKCDTQEKKRKKGKKVEKGLAEHIDAYESAAKNRIARTGKLSRTPAERKLDASNTRFGKKVADIKAKAKMPTAPGLRVKRLPKPKLMERPGAPAERQKVASIQGDDLAKSLDAIFKSFGEADTVLGHTARGKPVKVHGDYHGKFDAEDHRDAADIHDDVARKFEQAGARWGSDKVTPAARKVFEKHGKHHRVMAEKHRDLARKADPKGGAFGASEAPTLVGAGKSPLFEDAKKSLTEAVRAAVKKAVADMQADRRVVCDVHNEVAKGLSGTPSTTDISKAFCTCDEPLSKSAVALRATDQLLSDPATVRAAKELGIELGGEWIEHILATTEDDED